MDGEPVKTANGFGLTAGSLPLGQPVVGDHVVLRAVGSGCRVLWLGNITSLQIGGWMRVGRNQSCWRRRALVGVLNNLAASGWAFSYDAYRANSDIWLYTNQNWRELG